MIDRIAMLFRRIYAPCDRCADGECKLIECDRFFEMQLAYAEQDAAAQLQQAIDAQRAREEAEAEELARNVAEAGMEPENCNRSNCPDCPNSPDFANSPYEVSSAKTG